MLDADCEKPLDPSWQVFQQPDSIEVTSEGGVHIPAYKLETPIISPFGINLFLFQWEVLWRIYVKSAHSFNIKTCPYNPPRKKCTRTEQEINFTQVLCNSRT